MAPYQFLTLAWLVGFLRRWRNKHSSMINRAMIGDRRAILLLRVMFSSWSFLALLGTNIQCIPAFKGSDWRKPLRNEPNLFFFGAVIDIFPFALGVVDFTVLTPLFKTRAYLTRLL
ncbi:hypothetical protein B0H17DRAFT_1078024 [Mycena rosella]|uniref:Uncharacterized protein n=1 Tax=Mycena rosella TaxID=1033263 RepID=A0AAD7D4U0_MYCRO|nr:hypothetical protein B0H17DRAFT_1078024 [Mycena rosella]